MMRPIIVIILIFVYANVHGQNTIQIDSILANIQNNLGKDYSISNYISIQGKKFNKQDLLRRFTLVNLWFESCGPCVAEFSELNKLYKKYKGNKKFNFISFTSESSKDALRIAKKFSIEYPVICISREQCYKLNFNNGFPTTLIINKKGKVAYIDAGGPIDSKIVLEKFSKIVIPKIDELLKNK